MRRSYFGYQDVTKYYVHVKCDKNTTIYKIYMDLYKELCYIKIS